MILPEEENYLIDRILKGHEQDYAQLVDHYKRYVFTIVHRVVEERAVAEEVAQDAFIKAFQHLKTFNRTARFSTWLYRIAFNTAISYKRKNNRKFESIDSRQFEASNRTDAEIEKNDKKVFIARAMRNLSEPDQLAIKLFYIKEFSLEEVAALLDQNTNTVKVRIHRARLRLADELNSILKKEALTL